MYMTLIFIYSFQYKIPKKIPFYVSTILITVGIF